MAWDIVAILFACAACAFAGYWRGRNVEAEVRLNVEVRLLEVLERDRGRTAQLVESLGRACGWAFQPATKAHLARWVPLEVWKSCEDASAPFAVAQTASTSITGTTAGVPHTPKKKRARGSSTGAGRKPKTGREK